MTLPRLAVANSPLQSYFVDPDFAAAATSHAFGGVGRPYWVPVFGRSGQITVYRLWTALAMMTCLLVALACGEDSDERMVRRYADCMADPNTTLHRRTVANAVGAVPRWRRGCALNWSEAMEARLRAQLERGEVTMAEIRADHARYCE